MLAIETRYLGPTNYHGSRVIARVMESLPTRRITVSWDDALGTAENHRAAAIALIRKLEWTSPNYGAWVEGSSERGYVYVCDTRHGGDRFEVTA